MLAKSASRTSWNLRTALRFGSSKVFPDAKSALHDIKDGATLYVVDLQFFSTIACDDCLFRAVGGFGLCGIPENLIAALRDSGAK